VPLFPTPPLSNAPLVPIKKLPPVTLDIMDLPVMLLVKRAMPVPLQIPEHHRDQRRVLLVPRVCIRCLRTLNLVLRAQQVPIHPQLVLLQVLNAKIVHQEPTPTNPVKPAKPVANIQWIV
jgi:hypothetical protein